MDYKELSKWLWDIAKYVLTGVIISSFLGNFDQNTFLLYGISTVLVAVLFFAGVYYQKKSKETKK